MVPLSGTRDLERATGTIATPKEPQQADTAGKASSILHKAAHNALGGGLPGMAAMVVQVTACCQQILLHDSSTTERGPAALVAAVLRSQPLPWLRRKLHYPCLTRFSC